MLPSLTSAVPIFSFRGIRVSIHWTWFLVAVYSIQNRADEYSSLFWNMLEYLALFGIVLLHEFGHSLACRQVGGEADRIVLWPLGGVAFVNPPPRAGAQLWSIAAGPLVNIALAPLLLAVMYVAEGSASTVFSADALALLSTLWQINLIILLFNLLPIYPLDGGQILRSLLWFVMGPIYSLAFAAGIGVLGAGGLAFWAATAGREWLALLAAFLFFTAVQSFRRAIGVIRES